MDLYLAQLKVPDFCTLKTENNYKNFKIYWSKMLHVDANQQLRNFQNCIYTKYHKQSKSLRVLRKQMPYLEYRDTEYTTK